MSDVETRQASRDSLFLFAQLRIEGQGEHCVKVRNLSSGGMMAEGDVRVSRGLLLSVELRNIGWVKGSVAWKQDNRFGIAFAEEIDARLAQTPVVDAGSDYAGPSSTRTIGSLAPTPDSHQLRRA